MVTEISPELREEAVRRYVAGETSTAIAETWGLSPSTVLEWVRAHGHAARSPGRSALREDFAAHLMLLQRYEGGCAVEELAEEREEAKSNIYLCLRIARAYRAGLEKGRQS
jgi:transposase-like protein